MKAAIATLLGLVLLASGLGIGAWATGMFKHQAELKAIKTQEEGVHILQDIDRDLHKLVKPKPRTEQESTN